MDFNAEHIAKRMINTRQTTEYGNKQQGDTKIDEEDEEIRRAMEAQASRSVAMTSLGRNDNAVGDNESANTFNANKENLMGLSIEEYQKLRLYTLDDISRHDKADDCWFVIGYIVYDLSTFIYKHPGGPNILLAEAGKDITNLFHSSHTSIEKALAMLRNNTSIKAMGRIKKLNEADGSASVASSSNTASKDIVSSFHQQQFKLERKHRDSDSDSDYSASENTQSVRGYGSSNENYDSRSRSKRSSHGKTKSKSRSKSRGGDDERREIRVKSKSRDKSERRDKKDKQDKKSRRSR